MKRFFLMLTLAVFMISAPLAMAADKADIGSGAKAGHSDSATTSTGVKMDKAAPTTTDMKDKKSDVTGGAKINQTDTTGAKLSVDKSKTVNCCVKGQCKQVGSELDCAKINGKVVKDCKDCK